MNCSVKILHIVSDEKFIPFVMDVFAAIRGCTNKYLLRNPSLAGKKYTTGISFWREIGESYIGSAEEKIDLSWCDCLVVHYMDSFAARIVRHAPASVRVVWSGWGGDYYHFFAPDRAYFGMQTQKIVRRSLWDEIVSELKRRVRLVLVDRLLVSRVDFFSAPIREDYLLFKSTFFGRARAEFIQLNYASYEDSFFPGVNVTVGKNVLVGNSATPQNNHLDIFFALKRMDLHGAKIVVPLSYGCPEYRDVVMREGKRIFGENFYPITDFMVLADYNSLLSGCGVVFMGHLRQQGLGNICSMLVSGAKVFLSRKNPVYAYLERLGCEIFDIDSIGADWAQPLSTQSRTKNADLIAKEWGRERVQENANVLIQKISIGKSESI